MRQPIMRPIWLVVLIIPLLACGLTSVSAPPTPAPTPTPSPTPKPPPETAVEGQPFTLPEGGATALGESGAQLRFIGVTDDSRCPTDVACIWSGEVTVEVAFVYGGLEEVIALTWPGATRPDEFEREGVTVHLESVDPYPVTANALNPPYTATFVMITEGN